MNKTQQIAQTALFELADENASDAVLFLAANLVGLCTELAKRRGLDPALKIEIENGASDGRTITIEAVEKKEEKRLSLRACRQVAEATLMAAGQYGEDYQEAANHGIEVALRVAADTILEPFKFPVALRKMWSGSEVQKWLDDEMALRMGEFDDGGRAN